MMHGREKSDSAIVAGKPTNKAVLTAAEPVERRAEAKGNASQQSTRRTQSRVSVSHALERIRQNRNEKTLCRHTPKVGAVCGNSARTDLCGGRSVMSVPTAISEMSLQNIPLRGRTDARRAGSICSAASVLTFIKMTRARIAARSRVGGDCANLRPPRADDRRMASNQSSKAPSIGEKLEMSATDRP
jgi:hypothetical protein